VISGQFWQVSLGKNDLQFIYGTVFQSIVYRMYVGFEIGCGNTVKGHTISDIRSDIFCILF
jgi:hypothetical protein